MIYRGWRMGGGGWRMFLLFLVMVSSAEAQQARTGLTRKTIQVGDRFGVAVEFEVPAGGELLIPDTLDVSGDVENAARKRVQIDTTQSGSLHYLVTYPITVWRPGTDTLPPITATIRANGTERSLRVDLPVVIVTSVLPADTSNLEPKPPRDVWGANRLWWPIILAAALGVALIALLIWWWRRRRRQTTVEPVVTMPAVTPREWALRELERLTAARLIERGEVRLFYIELSEILRKYLALLDNAWSTDLTTNELSDRLIASKVTPGLLFTLIDRADLVKFARHRPPLEQGKRDLEAARAWVDYFEPPALALPEAA
jgi:hypothetical protein